MLAFWLIGSSGKVKTIPNSYPDIDMTNYFNKLDNYLITATCGGPHH
jgi:hypothetical protein